MNTKQKFQHQQRLRNHKLYTGRMGQLSSRFIYLALLALILWLPLPLGSNRLWALAIIQSAVAFLCLLWAAGLLGGWVQVPRLGRTHALMGLVWLLWLLWVVFQCLPLQQEWIARLSPSTAGYYAAAASHYVGNDATNYSTLSVSPSFTLNHLYESITYAVLFWLIIMVCSVRHRLRAMLWAIFLSGLLQALYGSFMMLSGIEYGFLQHKEHYLGSATGTFVNRNHFAGYLELSVAAGLGLLLMSRRRTYGSGWRARLLGVLDLLLSPSILIQMVLVALFLGLILSHSRMGNTALIMTLAVFSVLYLVINRNRLKWHNLLLMFCFIVIELWWVAGWFGGQELIERFENTQLETELRAKMWPDLKKMVTVWPQTGSGLGTFHVVYPHFQGQESTGFNLHAHNDYVQFLIELGIPGTLLLLSIAGLTLLRALYILKSRRERTALGIVAAAMLAIISLGLHSVADFNLQIPANSATLVIMLALVWCCETRSSRMRHRAVADAKPAALNRPAGAAQTTR